jgi:hypothetical protein
VYEPDNTAGKQGGGQFKPGQSGNPAGRPKGARHRTTLAIEALLEGEHAALTRKAIEMALAGDTVALRLCLDRIAPARKDTPVSIELPPVKTLADAVIASSAVLAAVAAGECTPDEGGRLMAMLSTHRTIVEAGDLEARILALEAGGRA